MRDINLLQEQTSSVAAFDAKASLRPALLFLGVLVVLIVGAYVALIALSAKNVAQTLDAAAEAATYQQAADAKSAVAAKQAQVASLEELLGAVSASGTVSTEVLSSVTGSLAGDAFLQTLTLDDAKGMELTGIAPTRADVAALAYNLKQTGLFLDVEIATISQQQQEGEAAVVYSFSIGAVLKGGEQGE